MLTISQKMGPNRKGKAMDKMHGAREMNMILNSKILGLRSNEPLVILHLGTLRMKRGKIRRLRSLSIHMIGKTLTLMLTNLLIKEVQKILSI